MVTNRDPFEWITLAIPILSFVGAIVATVIAKAFKSGKKEAMIEGTDTTLHNLIINAVKEIEAIKNELKKSCVAQTEINLRLTQLETEVKVRREYQDRVNLVQRENNMGRDRQTERERDSRRRHHHGLDREEEDGDEGDAAYP